MQNTYSRIKQTPGNLISVAGRPSLLLQLLLPVFRLCRIEGVQQFVRLVGVGRAKKVLIQLFDLRIIVRLAARHGPVNGVKALLALDPG